MTFTVGMEITADASGARRGLQELQGQITGFSRQLARLALQAAGITSITAALAGSVRAAADAERSQLRLEAVIRATGRAAGRGASEIEALAREIGKQTLASTRDVRAAAAQLLTFRSVAGETFDRTMWAAQDLAELGFGSIESAAVQLGKALEDPVAGIAALQRVGVSFSASQREVIKQLVETGRMAEAQRIILEGVERQVGGSGVAAGKGLAGAFDGLGEELRRFGENLGRRTNESILLAGALNSIAGAIAAVNAQLDVTPRTVESVGAQISVLRAEREEVRRQLATAGSRVSANPAMPGQPLSLAEQFTPDPGATDAAGLQARFDRLTREIDEGSRVWVRLRNERVTEERQTAETQAQIARELAEEAARRAAEARGGDGSGGGSGGAAAIRDETTAVQGLIDQLVRERELMHETDPVRRALIEHREVLAQATEGNRVKLEALIETVVREGIALEQGRAMWETFGRTATDALGAIALQGRSLKDVLGGVIRMLGQATFRAAFMGAGPMAGLFPGGGLFPAAIPALRRAGGGPVVGPGGPTDDRVPILASNGEFVVNAAATARNRPLLEAINAGLPGFAAGGLIGPGWRQPAAAMGAATPPMRRGGQRPVVVHIHTRDAESFRGSRTQVAATMARALAQAERGA